jgi:hypothetical protein
MAAFYDEACLKSSFLLSAALFEKIDKPALWNDVANHTFLQFFTNVVVFLSWFFCWANKNCKTIYDSGTTDL